MIGQQKVRLATPGTPVRSSFEVYRRALPDLGDRQSVVRNYPA